jgi:hypothetical protein
MRFKAGKLVLLATLLAGTGGQAIGLGQPRQAHLAVAHDRAEKTILQLRSGNFQAGFLPDRAFLPIRGHALTVEFVGTPGVLPTALADPGLPVSEARRALYEDLWPGVSLSFTLSPRGVCEATYTLAPGADVAEIRLRYNVPARVRSDGTLWFRFSSGQVSESSPEAWQVVGDRRKTVAASFAVSGGEVGFNVGSYDHSIPLTIDPAYRIAEARVNGFAPLRGGEPQVLQLSSAWRPAAGEEQRATLAERIVEASRIWGKARPQRRGTSLLCRCNEPPINNQERLRPTHEQPQKGFPEEYANQE